MKQEKPLFKKTSFWLLIGATALFIGFLVYIVISDIKGGWNGEKTIRYAFFIIVFICSISMLIQLMEYAKLSGSKIVKSNNELYLTSEKAEKMQLLDNFQKIMDNKARNKQISEINAFISYRCKSAKPLTHDNIEWFIRWKKYNKSPYNFSYDDKVELLARYYEYKEIYSKKYQRLLAGYKSKEMVRVSKFPLLTTIVPLLISFVSIFALIYQDVSSNEGIKETFTSFLILFVITIMYDCLLFFWTLPKIRESTLKENKQIVEELMPLVREASKRVR